MIRTITQRLTASPAVTICLSLLSTFGLFGSSQAWAQKHGLVIGKSCAIFRGCVPFTPECTTIVSYADGFGDALIVFEAFDIVDPGGAAIRVPAVGELPIIGLFGNAVALGPGGSWPVMLGQAGATYESPFFPGTALPGAPEPGVVVVLSAQFEMQSPGSLPIVTVATWWDECDSGTCIPWVDHQSGASALAVGLAAPAAAPDRATICRGQTAAICANAGGGTPPYVEYAWTGPGGFSSDEECVVVSAAGTYEVVVTDSAGCISEPAVGTVRLAVSCDCLAADLDHDVSVGFADLLLLLSEWGPCEGCGADLDRTGDVGFADLLILLMQWGPCVQDT